MKMEQTQYSETSAIKHHTPEHLPMKMEQTQCSETSVIKHHTPENNPKFTHDKDIVTYTATYLFIFCGTFVFTSDHHLGNIDPINV
jgi:hypothetical protein